MARWEPGSRERLQGVALDLFNERGFEDTTVADIATQAGVNKRTFFRHFTDKRDVLFAGAAELETLLLGRIVEAQSDLAPLDAIAAALAVVGTDSMVPRHYLRLRQAVIAANSALMERQLIKFDSLTAVFTDGLRQRGIDDPAAGLAAQAGISVFRTAYSRWVEADEAADMGEIVHDVLTEFRSAVAS
ncbi:MAG: TetR family transcriptional regulator [Acidimicrobiales bacterium]